MAAFLPFVAAILFIFYVDNQIRQNILLRRVAASDSSLVVWAAIVGMAGALPLPLLLALRLRDLARRAGSPHLAEHCRIVGVGVCLAMAYYMSIIYDAAMYRGWAALHPSWARWPDTTIAVALAVEVCGWLFLIWSVYLLVRFAIAFQMAATQLSRRWKRDDRSVTVEST